MLVSVALVLSAAATETRAALGAPPIRTVRVAPAGVDPNGPSAAPSIGGDGRYVAFASRASNLGPIISQRRISNVYVFDFATGRATLISSGPGGGPANGPSTTPSISANGQVVAFASDATNLVAHTPRHVSEIFARVGAGPIRLVSVGFGGVQPDGSSSQPAISADGRFVAFTSDADDLIAGDDNARPDVFVADLTTGKIRRVSVTGRGGQASGASFNPSISGDGHLVSFTSTAANLVSPGRKRVADVLTHNLLSGQTRRVSVSSSGRGQNASVAAPFTQLSDLSADGHYVVFDSNATNLVAGIRNGHTNVFRHSLVTGRTILISRGSRQRRGDNDSFAPATSADGGVTVFESFADNLVPRSVPGVNVFARDLTRRATLTLDVAAGGGPRGPELDPQLLQQVAVSASGGLVAFVSGADNLVANDYNGTDDVFVRVIAPTPPPTPPPRAATALARQGK